MRFALAGTVSGASERRTCGAVCAAPPVLPETSTVSAASGCCCCAACWPGRVASTPAPTAIATGTATSRARRHVRNCRRGGADCATARRTRSRKSGGATGRDSRSVRARSSCDIECLLELLQRARESRRAVGRRDAAHARSSGRVELEHDAKREHLALARGAHVQCCFVLRS